MKRVWEKIVEGILTCSGFVTSITILLIVVFLFAEALGLFNKKVIEEGYVLAVNKANPVQELSAAQIKDVFDEEITNWKELGGPDAEVKVFRLEDITSYFSEEELGAGYEKAPRCIGEIVAGIVLGPSVLGNLFPEASAFLFPVESLVNINMLSQFGLILFMFAIGMELNISEVRKKLKETILISHTSTIVPFFFGMLTAYFVYDKYADKSTPFLSFALFIGIAMSITAFPVLARIIQEKGLTKTHLGTISLDITAWCLLAVVIAIAQAGSMLSAVYNILFSVLYIMFMFLAVRPFLRMIGHIYHNKEVIDKGLVAFIFLLLITSAYLTEILGLHALFGAFIAGVVMPGNVKFRKIMTEKVEDVSLALFLPLFFVSTGLRTEIGLLNKPELWWLCLIFIVVAIAGKFGGAMFSARFVGESWKDSLYIGALMNTRGLMELVVLTIDGDIDTFRIRDLSANDAGHHLYDNTVGLIHQILLPGA